MAKKIYISGKITGDNGYREKFARASKQLSDAGYSPVNPTVIALRGVNWKIAMRVVLRLMLFSDGVALLPDWEESKGAKIEERLAREVGIVVKPIAEWLEHATWVNAKFEKVRRKMVDYLPNEAEE
jgi:hypothetical protein